MKKKLVSILERLRDCHTAIRKYNLSMSCGVGRDREKIVEIQEAFSQVASESDKEEWKEEVQLATDSFNTVYKKALELSALTIEKRLDLRADKLKKMKKSLDEYGCRFSPKIIQAAMIFSPRDLRDLKAAETKPDLEYTKLKQQCKDLNELYVSTKSLNDSLDSQAIK